METGYSLCVTRRVPGVGVVRMVMLRGGAYSPLERIEDLIKQWYCQLESILYLVTARGHDHRIRPSAILGQFVSRNR
jgi:hypothetical protein